MNITLKQALMKEDYYLRVAGDCKWLVYDNDTRNWIVYEKKPYQKKTKKLIETKSIKSAIQELILK